MRAPYRRPRCMGPGRRSSKPDGFLCAMSWAAMSTSPSIAYDTCIKHVKLCVQEGSHFVDAGLLRCLGFLVA